MKEAGIPRADALTTGWLGKLVGALRSIHFTRKARELRLRETLALGEKRQLLVVEWDSQRYLVGATPQGLTVLDRRGGDMVTEQQDSVVWGRAGNRESGDAQ